MKNLPFIFSVTIISILLIIIVSENIIKANKDYCYDDIDDIPGNKVGLVLGTSKFIGKNWLNYYYQYRIEAAVDLYKSGKIKFVLVSGDNSQHSYNEPKTIKNDLIKRGIPAKKIYLDYAGFRTFDSVIRSKKIFGQEKITIISQRFHNERAVFIAKHNGIEAVGYNAKPVTGKNGIKTRIRERFARVKAILDIYILRTKPKFLGNEIEINQEN
ncbi:MAG: YdcF family protein [Bacteroidales bacterium]|nr:YdcF family protein [Bacteroidales bacterium]